MVGILNAHLLPPDSLELAMIRSFVLRFAVTLCGCFALASSALAGELNPDFSQEIDRQLAASPADTEFAIWIGRPDGETLFERNAEQMMPTASAIKVAILLEFFAKYEDQLDSPPAGVKPLFESDHPAFSHFNQAQREEIEKYLAKATVAEIGYRMVHTAGAPNRVYNGATNIATALLGGPAKTTQAIHARDPAFQGIVVNRYQLADRKANGDNVASAKSLAAVLAKLATGKVAGLQDDTVQRIHKILSIDGAAPGVTSFGKSGSLSTTPVTRVLSGWDDDGQATLVYAIMGSAPADGGEGSAKFAQLRGNVAALRDAIAKPRPIDADVLLRGGLVFVGDDSEPKVGNVAIKDDKVIAVGDFPLGEIVWTIDCEGLAISPGFIDLHNHSDNPIQRPATRSAANYLTQGCTTLVTGNCGSGPVIAGAYYDKIDEQGAGVNIAHLLPQGSLRSRVVGETDRPATEDEMKQMKDLTDRAMTEGVWGMSTGLIYTPGSFADTDELVEIASVVSKRGGIYASHMRNEGTELLEAIEEILAIQSRANIPVHISHFKSSGQDSWGLVRIAIENIKAAQKKGAIVTADQYPYTASSTSLGATVIPSWARSGSRADMLTRIQSDTEAGARAREAMQHKLKITDNGHRIQIAHFSRNPSWAGRRLDEIAAEKGISTFDLVIEIEEAGGAQIVNHSINEDDVRYVMTFPWVATASDGGAKIPGASVPHPRSYGTFSRKIGLYSVREKIISLNHAVRSSTGLPADILGMTDRGYLRPGQVADIAVWDPKTFLDTATFIKPHQYSEGIKYVFVNGEVALSEGHLTGALPGKALRKVPKPAE
ncbi:MULTISPECIES: amidohydrolase family protein [Pirellulaceae]|nr:MULTISPECIES: amidohydrolase family protein [Pirellulaceae]